MTEVTIPETVETIGECAFGFEPVEQSDGSFQGTKQENFLIRCKADSPAKSYAEKNDLKYEQDGISKSTVIAVAIAAGAVLVIGVICILLRNRKESASADAVREYEETTDSEPDVLDPNYTSILADDDDDENDDEPEEADSESEKIDPLVTYGFAQNTNSDEEETTEDGADSEA